MGPHTGSRWRLTPLSAKAKSRVGDLKRQHPDWDGRTWRAMAAAQVRVQFSTEAGPWLLLSPVGLDWAEAARHSRWVRQADDKDFEVRAIGQHATSAELT